MFRKGIRFYKISYVNKIHYQKAQSSKHVLLPYFTAPNAPNTSSTFEASNTLAQCSHYKLSEDFDEDDHMLLDELWDLVSDNQDGSNKKSDFNVDTSLLHLTNDMRTSTNSKNVSNKGNSFILILNERLYLCYM